VGAPAATETGSQHGTTLLGAYCALVDPNGSSALQHIAAPCGPGPALTWYVQRILVSCIRVVGGVYSLRGFVSTIGRSESLDSSKAASVMRDVGTAMIEVSEESPDLPKRQPPL
jgi:hypothetical protein